MAKHEPGEISAGSFPETTIRQYAYKKSYIHYGKFPTEKKKKHDF